MTALACSPLVSAYCVIPLNINKPEGGGGHGNKFTYIKCTATKNGWMLKKPIRGHAITMWIYTATP
jgi:hypothetical protein